jgi:hypothetical protein
MLPLMDGPLADAAAADEAPLCGPAEPGMGGGMGVLGGLMGTST